MGPVHECPLSPCVKALSFYHVPCSSILEPKFLFLGREAKRGEQGWLALRLGLSVPGSLSYPPRPVLGPQSLAP